MRTAIFTTTIQGYVLLEFLRKSKIDVDLIVCLSSKYKEKISDYIDCQSLQNVYPEAKLVELENYRFSQNDISSIEKVGVDIGIVAGWHRIIPEDIVTLPTFGLWGFHAAPYMKLHLSRGGSPFNWAILTGKKKIRVYLFRLIAEAVDAGPIFSFVDIDISPQDDISTLKLKATIHMGKLTFKFLKSLPNIEKDLLKEVGEPRYLPQRKPEDGVIDWKLSNETIYNHVRALTKPYPGAFSKIKDRQAIVKFWKVLPFRSDDNFCPGKIINVFPDGSFEVATGKGTILVTDYECFPSNRDCLNVLKKEKYFEIVDIKETIRKIVDRHYRKFPDRRIHEEIEAVSFI